MVEDKHIERPQSPITEERSLGGISAIRPVASQTQSQSNTVQEQPATISNNSGE